MSLLRVNSLSLVNRPRVNGAFSIQFVITLQSLHHRLNFIPNTTHILIALPLQVCSWMRFPIWVFVQT